MSRATSTAVDTRAGCFACRGSDTIWTGGNAMAVAARHHDATGHQTWCDQFLSVRFGEAAGAPEPGLFDQLGGGA